ncbi:MAG: hypothetical protein C4B58_10160 [Deltaproteobacteria bacterium]|nr:MAG: hypothetical protein C4B58_10160 [Deltaproteobacteria bacterium]
MSCLVCVRLCVSVANTLILILLLLAPVVTHAYYKPITLEPAAEVLVKFQQEAGADPDRHRWGFCSPGDPAHPEAIALRKLGANATALFIIATDYPLRTYLDKTPLEYNLRYAVGQKLEEEARLVEDLRRLRESREKFLALLRELNINLEDLRATNMVYASLLQGLRNSPKTELHRGSEEDAVSSDGNFGKVGSSGGGAVRAGISPVFGKDTDVVRSDAAQGYHDFQIVRGSASRTSNANGPGHERRESVAAYEANWVDKVFSTIMAAIKWFSRNWEIICIGIGLLVFLGTISRRS